MSTKTLKKKMLGSFEYLDLLYQSGFEDLRIIGSDDWLVFARLGTQYLYTMIETNDEWSRTPFKGGFIKSKESEDGWSFDPDYPGSEREKQDWRHMLTFVALYPYEFQWEMADNQSTSELKIRIQTKEKYGW
jgi:hypothetical protein